MPPLNFSIDVVTISAMLLTGLFAFRDRFTLVKQLQERQEKFEEIIQDLTKQIAELTLMLSELRVEFHEYRKNNDR